MLAISHPTLTTRHSTSLDLPAMAMLRSAMLLRTIVMACVLFAAGPPSWSAASPPAPESDSCGDPATANQAYRAQESTVLEVIDSVTLLVEIAKQPPNSTLFPGCSAEPCRVRVRLVDLEAPSATEIAAEARRSLAAETLSNTVTLWISPFQTDDSITNVLLYRGTDSVNRRQLESGLATFRDFGPYAVDGYLRCDLVRAQEVARRATRGLWAAQ